MEEFSPETQSLSSRTMLELESEEDPEKKLVYRIL